MACRHIPLFLLIMHENAARCSCYGAGLVITVALALSLSIHSTWAMGTFLYSVCFFFFLSGVCVRACPISFVGHLQGVSTRCRGSAYARTDAGYKEERQLGIDRASLSLLIFLPTSLPSNSSVHKMPTGVSPRQAHRSTRRMVSVMCPAANPGRPRR